MNGAKVRVEIVTPVHNRKDLTLRCLKSLSRLTLGELDVHIIIVDDGSTDGTGDAIRTQFPDVEIIAGNGDLWFTEGTNVGIRRALVYNPDFVLLINDDAVFDSEFLVRMVETAQRHPRSIVGSLLLLWDTPHRLFQVAPVWDTLAGGWRHWRQQTVWTIPTSPWKVDIIVGNCLLVPSAVFTEAGLMDSRRFPNFGDAEFTPRLKRLGWTLLIEPGARVFCQPNARLPRIQKMNIRQKYDAFIGDLGNNYNLRRRFYENLAGAPSNLHAVLAMFIFLVRAVLGLHYEKRQKDEEPLTKTFASAVVDD